MRPMTEEEIKLWERYKATMSPEEKERILKRLNEIDEEEYGNCPFVHWGEKSNANPLVALSPPGTDKSLLYQPFLIQKASLRILSISASSASKILQLCIQLSRQSCFFLIHRAGIQAIIHTDYPLGLLWLCTPAMLVPLWCDCALCKRK